MIGLDMDPKKVSEAIAETRLEDVQFDLDMKEALKSGAMRRILWWLMTSQEMCDIYGIPMTTNAEVYFSSGRRFIGMVLFKAIEHIDPGSLLRMQKEGWDLEKVNAGGELVKEGDKP